MQVAARPHLTAGVALVGAGVIAVSPLAPPMPDIHLPSVQSTAVELASAVSALASPVVSPIEQWTQVVQAAITNLGGLGQQLAADPAPILQQILANQSADAAILGTAGAAASTALTTAAQALPAALQTAATQLAAGNVTAAVATLTAPVIPLALGLIDAGFTGADAWQVAVKETQNLANAVAVVPSLVLSGVLAVASPLISDINASAAIGQAIADAGKAGDLEGVVTALVNAPATLTGATLNGYGTNPILGTPEGGLLSGPGIIPGITDGTISGLLTLRDAIAKALGAPASKTLAVSAAVSPAALPAAGATTVALTTAPVTKAIAAPAPKAAKDSSATDTSAAAAATGATTGATDVTTGNKVVPGTTGTSATKSGNAPLGAVSDGIKAAITNVGQGITKAVSGGTGKSTASAGSSSGAGKSSSGSGGGRHRK